MKKILSFTLGLFTLFTSGGSCLAHTAKIYSKFPDEDQSDVRLTVVDNKVYLGDSTDEQDLKYVMIIKTIDDMPAFKFHVVDGQWLKGLLAIYNNKLLAHRRIALHPEQIPESIHEIELGNINFTDRTLTSQGMTFLKMEGDTVYYCPAQEYTEASKTPIFRVEGPIFPPMLFSLAFYTLVSRKLYVITIGNDNCFHFNYCPVVTT